MVRDLRLVLVLMAIGLAGCVSPSRNTVGGGGGGGGTGGVGQMYVATPTSILRFSSATTASGNVGPAATITGATTTLSSPRHILVDSGADRLFVANQGNSSILIFENVSTKNGNIAPDRTVSGNATLLSAPTDIALDTANNLLYVADGTHILVYAGASTINGNTPPTHNIAMGFTVGAIFLDSPNNTLYVADTPDNAVDVLGGANGQDVTGFATGVISGAATLLGHPGGIALDSAGRLVVANSSVPNITIFSNAATASGNIAPAATISGSSTTLASPGQIAIDRSAGVIYVADNLAGSIVIFGNIAGATGNIAPTRVINGSATGLVANAVSGVAIDPNR